MRLIDNADDLPPGARGVYLLLIRLDKKKRIQVGRLGLFEFPPGWYVYAGSAMGGLAGRLKRHLRKHKKNQWHIDYLLSHAEVRKIAITKSEKKHAGGKEKNERLECRTNKIVQKLPESSTPAPRFGASDCRCPAHLTYLGGMREEKAIELLRGKAGEIRGETTRFSIDDTGANEN
ncbi:MAG: GIY-YIG nuclease family protein [bacterium]